ncbi:MAG: PD40 domain-containing protein [Fimbriimonadaceae bacterium]|nr:PD40 domain-containing protein [Fimbriimonadaceae bacterium]
MLIAAVALVTSASPIGRIADPAISPDGMTLAFSWQGDIWTVPSSGGRATRLTVHPADDSNPVWSPVGDRIVFASNRFGSLDAYSMTPDGDDLHRLTYEAGSEYPTAVSPDGSLVIGYSNSFGRLDLFSVSMKGGDAVRLTGHPLEPEHQPCFLPDGTTIVYCQGGSPGHWRKPGQKGANTARLYAGAWGAPLQGIKRLTSGDTFDLFPTPLGRDRLVFVSNRSGEPNLWSMPSSGGTARQHTRFSHGTIRFLSASKDGSKVAFQKDSQAWVLDTQTGTASPIRIETPMDATRDPLTKLRLDTGAQAFAASPNGKRAVIEVRGDLFLLPERGGTTRRLTTNPGYDGDPGWLNDETIVYCSAGASGHRSLKKVNLDGESSEFASDPGTDLMRPVVSPDRSMVACHRGMNEIVTFPASGGSPTVAASGAFADSYLGGAMFAWSPDSAWITYSTPLQRSVAVNAVEVKSKRNVLVAKVGKSASGAMFSPDAKFVAFSGVQGTDYSEVRDGLNPVYSVRLAPAPLRFSEDDLDKIEEPQQKPGKPEVAFVPEGIAERLSRTGAELVTGLWPGPDGSRAYANVASQFSTVDLENGATRAVPGVTGPVSGVSMSTDGRKTYFIQGGKVFSLPSGAQAPSPINFSAELTVDYAVEEQALFDEVWWTLNRLYYDPGMHGKDWGEIHEEFGRIVPAIQSREDFYELMGEMMELLDSSHLGATSPPGWRPTVTDSPAWLGIEWDWNALLALGEYRVGTVYPESPAANPGSLLRPGDVIASVNGVKPGALSPMAVLLDGKAGRKVVLGVRSAAGTREVAIRPSSSGARTGAQYEEWVRWNRAEVERLSGGKLGYVHIQGMNVPSLDKFLTETQTMLDGKEGVIVDVRFNGGGFTSHIILNIMRKTPWLIRTNRDEPGRLQSENSYRGNAVELPAACLANQFSFSNAEIFSEGFRRLKLGPIVGEPTAGGVIGTSGFGLWDGGFIRLPAAGSYTIDGVDLEGNGRKPDIRVDFDPEAWNHGKDPQLEATVKALLKSLGN